MPGNSTLASVVIGLLGALVLGGLLWIQTSRLDSTKDKLAEADKQIAIATLNIDTLKKDYSATLILNETLQKESANIRSELNKKNRELQYYIGRIDELAKKDPALVQTRANDMFIELMQSVSKTTSGSTTQSDNPAK